MHLRESQNEYIPRSLLRESSLFVLIKNSTVPLNIQDFNYHRIVNFIAFLLRFNYNYKGGRE